MLLPQCSSLCRPGKSGTPLTMLTLRRSFTSESTYLEASQDQTVVRGGGQGREAEQDSTEQSNTKK